MLASTLRRGCCRLQSTTTHTHHSIQPITLFVSRRPQLHATWQQRSFHQPTDSWRLQPTESESESTLDSHTTSGETLLDGDAADFVPKEVSAFDRPQTNLSSSQKDAARVSDYEGDRASSPFTSGQVDPTEPKRGLVGPQLFEQFDPKKHAAVVDEEIEVAENERDS